jgi:hypothetical protein
MPAETEDSRSATRPPDPAVRVTIPRETLVQVFGDEAVVLSLASEQYFSFDDVATRMWQVLADAGSVTETVGRLLGEYEVDHDVLQRDVVAFVEELARHGLIEVSDASA